MEKGILQEHSLSFIVGQVGRPCPPKGHMNNPCEATHLKTALVHLAGHCAHVQTNPFLLMTQDGLITLGKSICTSLNCVLYKQQYFFSR